MRILIALAMSGALAALVCAQAPEQPFQPFGKFVAGIQAAQPGAYVGQPGFAVESAAAFAEMKAHLLELYRGVTARNSFVGPDGQTIDCIPIDQQPGLRPTGRPPAEVSRDVPAPATGAAEPRGDSRASAPRRSEDITLKRGQRDRFGNEMYCETGTIPMRRVTLERIATFRTLASFLSK
jgi:hypothetical protein